MTHTMQRLRVLHLLPSFGVGGAEQMAGHLMTGLSDSFDVAGVSLYPAATSSVEYRLILKGIPIWHLGKRGGFDPRMFSALDRLFSGIQPHVIHTHMSVLRYALPALLRRNGPVVVHTLHNMAEYETDGFGRFLQWFAFRGRVLPVAISTEVASSVERVYGLKSHAIVPNGIPVDQYHGSLSDRFRWRRKERFDDESILFTCVGRLEPQKNPLLLARAFAALNDPRAHLVMLGEGSLGNEFAAFARQRRLEHRIHLLGKREEVRECLAASDVFVLSSNWEGNPLAVMEAMAAGLPVVATAVGGVPELVLSGHGILIPPGDEAALTEAMRTLLNDPEQRAAMANAGRVHASQAFGRERMVERYAALYEAALSGTSRSLIHAPA